MTGDAVELRRCPSCPLHSAFVVVDEVRPYGGEPVRSDGSPADAPAAPLAARCPACGAAAPLGAWDVLRTGTAEELLRHHPPEADTGATAHLVAAAALEAEAGSARATTEPWLLRVRAWQLDAATFEEAPAPPVHPRAPDGEQAANLARVAAGPAGAVDWSPAVVAVVRAEAARQLGSWDEARQRLDEAVQVLPLEQADVPRWVIEELQGLVRVHDGAPRQLPVGLPDVPAVPVAWRPRRRVESGSTPAPPTAAARTRVLAPDRGSLAPPTPQQARRWKRLSIANVVAVAVVLLVTLGILVWLST